MSEHTHGSRPPERLRQDAELGSLIECANREFSSGLDEAAAFQRLSERLEQSREHKPWHRVSLGAALGLGAALSLGAVVAVAWGTFRQAEGDAVAFGPELATPKAKVPGEEGAVQGPLAEALDARDTDSAGLAKPHQPSDEREPEQPAEAAAVRALDSALAIGRLNTPERAPSDGVESNRPADTTAPKPAKPSSNAPARVAKPSHGPSAQQHAAGTSASRVRDTGAGGVPRIDCLEVSHRGDPQAAEVCFAQRAVGSGLGAEMALYEMARLRRDVLRDAVGALSALNDYRQRFPLGTLRNEVDISRVELLSQLGRSREALRESEALLGSASGRERAAELHVLRGNVFRHGLSDWAAAAHEYALAEPFGGSLGAEASRLRGMSLEALGDLPGAVAAYRRYLSSTPPSARRSEVARRVELLGSKATRAR